MENFDITKYLKENKLGSYGMFNGYVDLKPLKEEEDVADASEVVPYEGADDQLTGLGDEDTFEQDDVVSENEEFEETDDRIMMLGGSQIEKGIMSLMQDGFPAEDILELCDKLVALNTGAPAGYGDEEFEAPEWRDDRLSQRQFNETLNSKNMKMQLNQLRQIIREEIENITTKNEAAATDTLPDYAGFYTVKGFKKGDFMLIKPNTKLKVGQDVVTMNNTQFGTISKIDGDKYTITWADYGDKVRTNRQKLEKFWLLVKPGR